MEPPPPPGAPGAAGPRHPGEGPPLDRILLLKPEQKKAYDALRAEQQAAAQPLRDEERRTEAAFRAALETETPDPTAVGEKAIALHRCRKALRTIDDRFRERLSKILTDEQRARLESMPPRRNSAPPQPPPPAGDPAT
jgi:Spy/CpxP family protein refolding chaperone